MSNKTTGRGQYVSCQIILAFSRERYENLKKQIRHFVIQLRKANYWKPTDLVRRHD